MNDKEYRFFGSKYMILFEDGQIVVSDIIAKLVCVSYPVPVEFTELPVTMLGSNRVALQSFVQEDKLCIFKVLSLETGKVETLSSERGVDSCICFDDSRLLLYDDMCISEVDQYRDYDPVICYNYLNHTMIWKLNLNSHFDSADFLGSGEIVGSLLKSVLLGREYYCSHDRCTYRFELCHSGKVANGYPIFYSAYKKELIAYAPKLISSRKQCSFIYKLCFIDTTFTFQ